MAQLFKRTAGSSCILQPGAGGQCAWSLHVHHTNKTAGCCSQVLCHQWVTDSGRLPAVQHFSDACSQLGAGEGHTMEHVLTALKKQVSAAAAALGHSSMPMQSDAAGSKELASTGLR